MAVLIEEEIFEAGIHQLEITDPVQGGPNGIDNLQAKQLANRTKWLKAAIDFIVGSTFEAAIAVKLKTIRKINGVDFDGTSDITIPLIPTGSVIFLARSTAPSGYLKANGAAVSRTTYSELFLAIGTTFGAGNGSTTFNLPDLRGEFIRGWDDGRGADIGRAFAAWQDSANKSHNHGGATDGQSNDHSHYTPGYKTSGGGIYFGGSGGNMGDSSGTYGVNVNHTHGIYSDGASEARPRNIALLACIKY